jgi:hypothetical protein
MSRVGIKELDLLAVSKEIHNFVLTLSWNTTVRIEHLKASPIFLHQLHNLYL